MATSHDYLRILGVNVRILRNLNFGLGIYLAGLAGSVFALTVALAAAFDLVRTDELPATTVIVPLGRIANVVETFVLVQSNPGVAPLDAASLLCLGNRRVLGQVRARGRGGRPWSC